jgi:hypothetical protein
VRERLREWFAKHPVISLGYSGGDLEFAADYLTLRVIPAGTDRIWWVIRPEDRKRIEPTTQALVDPRGAFVAMPQAAALEAMGAGPVALERKDESRRERLALLRSQANRLFKKQRRVEHAGVLHASRVRGRICIPAALSLIWTMRWH